MLKVPRSFVTRKNLVSRLRLLWPLLLAGAVLAIFLQMAYDKASSLGYSKGYAHGVQIGTQNASDYAQPEAPTGQKDTLSTLTPDTLSIKINQLRQAIGLPTLAPDPTLAATAQKDIEDVCDLIKDPNFHFADDPNKLKSYKYFSEIVSDETTSPKSLTDTWLASKQQQPILLEPGFNSYGIGQKDRCIAVIFAKK